MPGRVILCDYLAPKLNSEQTRTSPGCPVAELALAAHIGLFGPTPLPLDLTAGR